MPELNVMKVVWDSNGGGNLNYFQFTRPETQEPSLQVRRTETAMITLEWTPSDAALETAPDLTSNWTSIQGAVSPYPITPVGAMRYFRLAPPSGSGSMP